jgi:hypothetical protein
MTIGVYANASSHDIKGAVEGLGALGGVIPGSSVVSATGMGQLRSQSLPDRLLRRSLMERKS